MEEYKIYAAGEFISTSDVLSVVNPFSKKEFARTYLANENILENAIEKGIHSQIELKKLSTYQKASILNFIADEMEINKTKFIELICMEAAKPYKNAKTEVERAIYTFCIAAEECKRLPAEVISLDWTPSGKNKEGIVKYFPIGLVAAISPFNFPLNLAVHKIAPAIAAGCPVILKPATKTPLSTLLLVQIIDKSELPKGAFSVLPCSRTTGEILIKDERIKLLTFTGSPQVGWDLKNKAGKKKVVLELGGNAGAIICKSADLTKAITKCVNGAFSYAGQVCIHTQRILVHESVFDQFVSDFCTEVSKLKIGNPLETDTDFSCLIDNDNQQRLLNWINEAQHDGAKILAGGKIENHILLPTIITQSNSSQKINCEEVFGPVVTIEKFTHFEDAVETLNNTRFGLQAGVFTDSQKEINYAFNNIEAGGIIINDVPTYRADHMPYGGVKDSGLGREGVKYAMMDMLEPRILVKEIE